VCLRWRLRKLKTQRIIPLRSGQIYAHRANPTGCRFESCPESQLLVRFEFAQCRPGFRLRRCLILISSVSRSV
jgi:hypothetical protein